MSDKRKPEEDRGSSSKKARPTPTEEEEEEPETVEDDEQDQTHEEQPQEDDIIEFDFKGKDPTAEELFEMATEERADNNDVVAVKLFEMAIEKFKAEDETKNKEEVAYISFVVAWAACLREFGEFYPIKEYLELASEKFQWILAQKDVSKKNTLAALTGLGRTGLTLALILREDALNQAEQENEDDDSEKKAKEPTAEELASLKIGQDAYNQVVTGDFLSSKPTDLANENALFAKYLCNYAKSQDNDRQQLLLLHAVELCKTANDLAPNDDFILSSLALILSALARTFAETDKEKALSYVEQSILNYENSLTAADPDDINADTYQGLGEAYMLHSTLLADDVEVLASYDKGLSFIKRALELAPERTDLQQLVEAMGENDSNVDLEDK